MKKLFISTAIMLITTAGTNASSYCNGWGNASETGYDTEAKIKTCSPQDWLPDPHCETLDPTYTFITEFEDGSCQRWDSCATCPSGYELQFNDDIVLGDICFYDGDNKIFKDQWTATQYMKIEVYQCVEKTYSCRNGQYGTTSDGTTGCNSCPDAIDIYTDAERRNLAHSDSDDYAKYITDCYIPTGTYYDATGTFRLTRNCSYKK